MACLPLAALLSVVETRAVQIRDWQMVNSNYFGFHLLCESNEYYLVQYSTNLNVTNWANWRYVDGRLTNRAMNVPNGGPIHFWRAVRTPEPMFAYALKAKENIEFTNAHLFTDSYDSSDRVYSTFGRYDPTKATDRGDVAVRNDSGTNTLVIENFVIKGTVVGGSNAVVLIGTNGIVGDGFYQTNAANRGTIQPGHLLFDTNLNYPDVVLPTGSSDWLPLPLPANVTVDGITYKYLLTTGDYLIPATNGTLSSKSFYVQGDVRLRVDSGINLTGSDVIRLGTNSTLQIFANCPVVNIGGNGIINPNKASALLYFGTPVNTSLYIGGNSEICGGFYATNAEVWLASPGTSTADFAGSCIGRSIRMDGNIRVHFDEALKLLPPPQ